MMGIYVSGELKGYSEKPWEKNGKSGLNRRIGIVTNAYEDEWGTQQQDITNIDVTAAQADVVKSACEQLKGQQVTLLVGVRAKTGGPNGAWLSFFMLKASQLIPQAQKKAA